MKSEARVQKIMNAMKETFINPFSSDLDPLKLFNLASGRPNDVAEDLLSYQEFDKRLIQEEVPTSLFFDPIKRNFWKELNTSEKKAKITAIGISKDITVQSGLDMEWPLWNYGMALMQNQNYQKISNNLKPVSKTLGYKEPIIFLPINNYF